MKDARTIPPQHIHTVDELVHVLRKGPGAGGYRGIMERVRIPMEQLERFCRWNSKHYTRNCVARTDDFELLLICYEPGQRTSIHDYHTEEAWVNPVEGSLVEERYEAVDDGGLRQVSSAKLIPGSFSYLHNGRSIHRYINDTENRCVTLNLYAKPLIQWKVYDERSGQPRLDQAGS